MNATSAAPNQSHCERSASGSRSFISSSPSAYEIRIKYSVSQTITKYARVPSDIMPAAIHTHRGVASRRCCIFGPLTYVLIISVFE